jgi:hypothetical protein
MSGAAPEGGEGVKLLAPEPVDLERIGEKVEELGRLQKLRARIQDVLRARIAGIDSRIAWIVSDIEPAAIRWREESGLNDVPIATGTITVRKKPPMKIRNELELIDWAAGRGLRDDPDICQRRWNFAALEKRLKWQKTYDELGFRAAIDPRTGEVVPGLVKYRDEGALSVSIKAGDVWVVGEDEIEETDDL